MFLVKYLFKSFAYFKLLSLCFYIRRALYFHDTLGLAHTCSSSALDAEVDGLSIQGKLGPHSETLSHNKQETRTVPDKKLF